MGHYQEPPAGCYRIRSNNWLISEVSALMLANYQPCSGHIINLDFICNQKQFRFKRREWTTHSHQNYLSLTIQRIWCLSFVQTSQTLDQLIRDVQRNFELIVTSRQEQSIDHFKKKIENLLWLLESESCSMKKRDQN